MNTPPPPPDKGKDCFLGSAEDCPSNHNLLEAVPMAVVLLDEKGHVQLWNKIAEEMFGWTSEEAVGRFLPILPQDMIEDFQEQFGRLLKGGQLRGLDRRCLKKSGEFIDISVSASPIKNKRGRVVSYMGLLQDISDRKKLEREFQQAQKMEAVGRLAGGVAHDFNNILTAISGYGQLLGLSLRDPDNRKDLDEMLIAAGRAAGLTRQLLAFSRQQVLQPHRVNCNFIVGGIKGMLRRLIGEDIEISVRLAADLGEVMADPGQIEQVLMNLVVNSRDAMPKGGRIAIETANVQLDAGYAGLHPGLAPGAYVMLAVSDAGCGMDAQTQARLFEPFFTTKEQGKGTGLGLATVYGIVRQSGGSILVHSEVGHGTVFKIYLPRAEKEGVGAGPAPARAPRLDGKETILCVEDDAMIRQLIQRSLSARGYLVLVARDPEDALAICRNYIGDIHLLLTDMVMPKMHGRDLARRILSLRAPIKVIYMSGYTDPGVVQNDFLQPGQVFLQKPLSLDGLAAKIRELLD